MFLKLVKNRKFLRNESDLVPLHVVYLVKALQEDHPEDPERVLSDPNLCKAQFPLLHNVERGRDSVEDLIKLDR